MDYPVSDELKAMLSGQTKCAGSAPTETMHVMGWANALLDWEEDADADHSPSGGEEFRPNAKPRLRIYRARPFLAVIDCGLC